ncbi:DUF2871 domain-containing protein [Streptomyces sp. NPDC048392]|uniref:DUF2871 domain-containing protein n=1 Tax=Streptomyces sp. NPDC048392 TaxID=3365543 RepID=UPI003711F3CD
MKKLYYSAVLYTALGLAAGLYYRELTKANDFTGPTQLAVVHTHLLVLGTLVFLIAIALEKTLHLTRGRFFSTFVWTYHAGLLLTTGLMTVHGTLTVLGKEGSPPFARSSSQPGRGVASRLSSMLANRRTRSWVCLNSGQ